MNRTFILTLLGVLTMGGNFACSHVSPPTGAMTEKIEAKVATLLETKYKMSVCGSGVAMPDGIVNSLVLCFDSYRSLSIEQARPILVDCVNTYVNAVNSNSEIKPYLKTVPFSPKNIEINIFFRTSKGASVTEPNLCVATALHGKLIYCTEEKGQKFGYKSETTEPYEEAVKILNEKNNKPQQHLNP